MIFVDGVNIGDPDDAALRDRREISADGIFIVVATISSDDGSVVADPEVIFRGVAFLEEADDLVEELSDLVEDSLEDAAEAGTREVAPDPGRPARRDRQVRLPESCGAGRWSCRSSSRSEQREWAEAAVGPGTGSHRHRSTETIEHRLLREEAA